MRKEEEIQGKGEGGREETQDINTWQAAVT